MRHQGGQKNTASQWRIGSPSSQPPPKSAPTWATKFQQKTVHHPSYLCLQLQSQSFPIPSLPHSLHLRRVLQFALLLATLLPVHFLIFEEAPCSVINDDTIDNPSDEDLDIMIRAATGCNFWLNRQDFLAKETCSTAYYRINCNLALFPNKLVFWPILHMCNEYAIKNYASAITYYYSQECIWSGYWRAAQGLVHTSCSAS